MRLPRHSGFLATMGAVLSLIPTAVFAAPTVLQITSPVVGTGVVNVVVELPAGVANLVVTDNNHHNIPITPSPLGPPGAFGYFRFRTKANSHDPATPLPLTVKATNSQQTLNSAEFIFSDGDIYVSPNCPCGSDVPDRTPPFNKTCASATSPFGQPDLSLPNGTNFAEATLNLGTGEAVNISCNKGAHSHIQILFSPNGTGKWSDGTNQNVTTIENSWVDVKKQTDDNCNRSGVYAYGLTRCTTALSTGDALGACPEFPTPARLAYCTDDSPGPMGTCVISRSPGVTGGTVQILYLGQENPPSTLFF